MTPDGDEFIYATPFPAEAHSVAVDSQGRAHVAGFTSSSLFPLVNPLQTDRERDDGVVAIIQANGKEFDFSTYLGGISDDWIHDIALDPSGNIYLGGETSSPDFPLISPFRSVFSFQKEAFVTKLAPNGTGYVFSTFFGGSQNEGINGIVADAVGNAYVAGWTTSPNLPQGSSPGVQPAQDGVSIDAFAAKLNPTGSALLYSTYLGGSIAETAYDIDLGPNGEIVVVGESTSVDFPTHRAFKSKSPFLKSADRGLSWRNDSDVMVMSRLNAVASHPAIPGVLLAATDHGVFRSIDDGEIWAKTSGGLNTNAIRDIAFDPINPSIAYLGSTGGSVGGVYKSIDGGLTWTGINSGITTREIYSIAIDPSNPNVLYAGSNGFSPGFRLYKSTNGGQSWAPIGAVTNISDVTIHPSNTSVLYVTSSEAAPYLFGSPDGGSTWFTIAPVSMGRGRSVELDPTDTSRIYVGADSGLYRSTDRALSWQHAVTGTPVFGVSVDPFDVSNIYVGSDQGLYISNDRGSSWKKRASGSDHRTITSVQADRGVPGVFYAGSLPYEDRDVFVVKIAPDGGSLLFSTLFGSTGDPNVPSVAPMPLDYAYGVDISPTGSVYTTGYTRMDNFPTTPEAVSNSFGGELDAFVVKLDDSRRISGKVTSSNGQPLDGVELELSGSSLGFATTLLDGRFKFNHVLLGGSFTVTPRKIGYTFQPANISLNTLLTDQTANFVAVGSNVRISGTVTQSGQPVPGAIVSVTGDSTAQHTTSADGTYSIDVPANGNYYVTASKPGLIFDPPLHRVEHITQNIQRDFAARAGFTISGQVLSSGIGMGSVPIRLTGAERAETLTDANGNFSFDAGAGGPYSIAPISSGVSFDPPISNIDLLNGPKTLLFQAVHPTFGSNDSLIYVGRTDFGGVANQDIFSWSNGSPQNLTNHLANERSPVWSPDGQKIAFASDRDGNWEIYVVNADGSNPLRLTNKLAVDDEPTWSPDSRQIAFVRTTGESNSAEIYVIDADGSNETRLTTNSIYEYSPAWSPDGAEIALVSEQDGNAEIYAIDRNGGIRRRLTINPLPDKNPAWSPDGTWIVFDSGVGTDREIWKIRRNGGSLVRLTDGSEESRSPVFSSDGQQVLFVALCLSPHLKVVSAVGGAQSDMTSCGVSSDTPSWRSTRQFPPFATIRGRLRSSNGGIIRVGFVTVQYSDGTTKRDFANQSGYYRISGVRTGEVVTITPSAKSGLLAPVPLEMLITNDVQGLDFLLPR
ncbi:MAG: carboxypeptidase regulatory-like domain-containing protein [Pyrinomonadaceae bacterium]